MLLSVDHRRHHVLARHHIARCLPAKCDRHFIGFSRRTHHHLLHRRCGSGQTSRGGNGPVRDKTAAQALQMILQTLLGFVQSGSTLTIYKRDNATTAIVGTFNSSSNATGVTQTT